jgi:hypothetical protein
MRVRRTGRRGEECAGILLGRPKTSPRESVSIHTPLKLWTVLEVPYVEAVAAVRSEFIKLLTWYHPRTTSQQFLSNHLCRCAASCLDSPSCGSALRRASRSQQRRCRYSAVGVSQPLEIVDSMYVRWNKVWVPGPGCEIVDVTENATQPTKTPTLYLKSWGTAWDIAADLENLRLLARTRT